MRRELTDLQFFYLNACPADFKGSTNEKLVFGKFLIESQKAIMNGKVTFTLANDELISSTSLSEPTIIKIVNDFIDDGKLIRVQKGCKGKKPVYYVIDYIAQMESIPNRNLTDLQLRYFNACPKNFYGTTNEKLVYGKLIAESRLAIQYGQVTFTVGRINIANEIGLSDRTISKILNKFIDEGKLIRTKMGCSGKDSVYKVLDCTVPNTIPSVRGVEANTGTTNHSIPENSIQSEFEGIQSTSNNNSNEVIPESYFEMKMKGEFNDLKNFVDSTVWGMARLIHRLGESNKQLNERLDKSAIVIKNLKAEIDSLQNQMNTLKGRSFKPYNCDEKLANTQKPYLYSPN